MQQTTLVVGAAGTPGGRIAGRYGAGETSANRHEVATFHRGQE